MSLLKFPEPRLPGAFRLAGYEQFRYGAPHAIRMVEYACYSVAKRAPGSPFPMMVYDCSTASGGTPAGRHPGGAHNGGINFDLGYYATQVLRDLVPGPHNGRQLTGPPTLLDWRRMALWFLAVAELEVAIGGQLVRLAAVDPLMEKGIDAAIQQADGFTAAVKQEAVRICYSSPGGGWGQFHHHHLHIRFNAAGNSEALASYINQTWIAPLLAPVPPPEPAPEPLPEPSPADEPDPLPDHDHDHEHGGSVEILARLAAIEARLDALEASP